jgi:hypothetical protein
MKTKLTLLLTTLAVAGIASFAMAGPDQQTMDLRKQNASSRTVASDSGSTGYVMNPTGKGGTVVRSDTATTNVALFKSSKTKSCEQGACCAKGSEHKH